MARFEIIGKDGRVQSRCSGFTNQEAIDRFAPLLLQGYGINFEPDGATNPFMAFDRQIEQYNSLPSKQTPSQST